MGVTVNLPMTTPTSKTCAYPCCVTKFVPKRITQKFCCKKCQLAWNNINPKSKSSRKNSYDKNKSRYLEKQRQKRRELKDLFFKMYGDKCNCCSESTVEFLTLDHINNNGAKIRREQGLGFRNHQEYKRAVNKYDPGEFQVLCMNCNSAKSWYGKCPHER